MPPEAIQRRIKKLQQTIREERAAIRELHDVKSLKPLLDDVSSLLDMLEHGYLTPEAISEEKTTGGWSFFVRSAEGFLKLAVRQRNHIAALYKKFGPDLASF